MKCQFCQRRCVVITESKSQIVWLCVQCVKFFIEDK